MKIDHYIFTGTGDSIKVELDLVRNEARVDGKHITIPKLEEQFSSFLRSLERYKKKAEAKK